MKKIVLIITYVFLIITMVIACSTSKKVKDIKFDKASLSMEIGMSDRLTIIYTPEEAEKPQMDWSSSDEKIVSVDSTGVVKAISAGKADIIAKTKDAKLSSRSSIEVKQKSVKGIKLSKESIAIEIGSTEKIQASVDPSDAANKNITWESSDIKIAVVDETGTVKGIAEGNADILAKTEEGGFTAKCIVTVKVKPQPVANKPDVNSSPKPQANAVPKPAPSSLKVDYPGSGINFYENNKVVMYYGARATINPQPHQILIKVFRAPALPGDDVGFRAVVNIEGKNYEVSGKANNKYYSFALPYELRGKSGPFTIDVYMQFRGKEYKFNTST